MADLLASTRSICAVCKRGVDARIVAREGAVWMEKVCPEHGLSEALVASSVEWYLDCLTFHHAQEPPRRVMKEVSAEGCPSDCGPCRAHEQKLALPIIPITSACNLDCPICYTVNKNEGAHMMSKEHFARILSELLRDHDELDIINFTGGEPTLHPELADLVTMAREAGVRRLTISTNGLKLLDERLVTRLAEANARVILSLDTLRPEIDHAMLGANTVSAKLRVLDMLEAHGVVTTLLPAVGAGYNDEDLPALLDLVLTRPHLCSLEVHPLTFTGQGGVAFDRKARITTPDIHAILHRATGGKVASRDFVPSPLAHPHCYSICYLLMLDGGGYVPLARLTSRQTLFDLLSDSLYLEPRERVEALFRDIIDDLWVNPDKVEESDRVLATLKRMLVEMFPASTMGGPEGGPPKPPRADRSPGRETSLAARQRVAERAFKAIYVHMHMDEETFDVAKVKRCPVGMPEHDGSNTPSCNYNVLYRERDPRFADPAMLARMDSAKQRRLPVIA